MKAVNTDSQKQSPTVSQLGKVVPLEGGRAMVEFERYLQHSPQRVWTALTDPTELAQWIPEIRLEPKLSGRYTLDFSGENSDCEGGPAVIEGKISEFEPNKILACGSMRGNYEQKARVVYFVLPTSSIMINHSTKKR